MLFFAGLSDASHDLHYSQLYDSCLQVPSAVSSNEFDIERRYFMSRVGDVVLRLLFHQVRTTWLLLHRQNFATYVSVKIRIFKHHFNDNL